MAIFFPLRKEYTKKAVAVYALYFVMTLLVHLFIEIPSVMLTANLILLFLITCCYEASFKKRFLASMYVYFLGFASEVLVTALTMTNITPFSKYTYSSIAGYFISKIVHFFIVLLIGNVVNIKRYHSMPLSLFLSSILIPIATIAIELLILISVETSMIIVVVSIVVLFFINAVVFFLYDTLSASYDQQLKAAISENERNYYFNQCKLMEESAEDIRNFRHDINNHIMLLQQLIHNGNEKEVDRYINELADIHQNLKIPYSATGNVVIDSILNYKLGSVSDPDLKLDVDVCIPTELSIDITDLSAILTNLLDNSLTAVSKVEKEKHISIKIIYQKGMLMINIINSYNGEIQYSKGKIVTTKSDVSEHGRGLNNVRNAVEKYDGLLDLTHDERIFTVKVLLYVK